MFSQVPTPSNPTQAQTWAAILTALEAYVADVRAGRFPEAQHTYPMPEEELQLFEAELLATSLGEKRHK